MELEKSYLTDENLEQVSGGEVEYHTVTRLCNSCGREFSYIVFDNWKPAEEPTRCRDCRRGGGGGRVH